MDVKLEMKYDKNDMIHCSHVENWPDLQFRRDVHLPSKQPFHLIVAINDSFQDMGRITEPTKKETYLS
ncbi:15244_t:CDS:2 [Entrophospora sp. SA101]|nr:15244_t:CDS:2 [Entrophospora sp. SA101]